MVETRSQSRDGSQSGNEPGDAATDQSIQDTTIVEIPFQPEDSRSQHSAGTNQPSGSGLPSSQNDSSISTLVSSLIEASEKQRQLQEQHQEEMKTLKSMLEVLMATTRGSPLEPNLARTESVDLGHHLRALAMKKQLATRTSSTKSVSTMMLNP